SVLLACSSQPSPRSEVVLSVLSHRMSELEPCGCSSKPRGGVARELEWRKKNDSALHLSVGTTFVPGPEEFQANQMELYRLKAKFVARALALVKTAVISPSAADTALGLAALQDLAKQSQIPWT